MANKISKSHPVDIHVGSRIRIRRKFMGMSQEDLALAIGLTFQQVQKYERGSNRVSASKLYEISRHLKAPIAYFFEGTSDSDPSANFEISSSEQTVGEFLATAEGVELASAFPHIKRLSIRRKILDLVRTLTED